jgi:hypothetical protein
MKEKHIIDILDSAPLASLAESELMTVRTHALACSDCRRAYEAAQLATLVIRERSAESVEPSPFFQTRVMAALREQQANNRVPVFSRLWKSAGALVSTMAATTAALAVLSFWAPGSETSTATDATAAVSPYSAEAVLLDQNSSQDQMTYDQVLNTIYVEEFEAK